MTIEQTPTEPTGDGSPAIQPEVVEVSPGQGATTLAATGASRQRWVLAVAVSAVVLAASALVAGLLAGRATPEVVRYIGADALVVVELRPEMPGDQRDRFAELLSHFPGFKDRTTLEQKLDESLDLLISQHTNGEVSYRDDVKPYLAGPAVFAASDVPLDANDNPPFLLVLTTDGTADCHLPEASAAQTETYRDAELQVSTAGTPLACALDDRWAIAGSPDAVRGAIDTKRDGGSIADDTTYREATSSLDGDHLGAVFVNARRLMDRALSAMPSTPAASLAFPVDDIPSWVAMQVRAEGDALVYDAVASKPSGLPLPSGSARTSTLADRLPGSTVVAFEGHDVGETIQLTFDRFANDPATSEMSRQLEDALRMVGGLDALTGWIKDAAIVGTVDGDQVGGGAVIRATDATKAAGTLASIRNLITLAGGNGGISLQEVDHGGTTIYVLDLGEAGSLFGLPSDAPLDGTGTKPRLAFAQRDDLVIVGVTEGFVEAVLDVGTGNSLADNQRYQHALQRAGASNHGQGFVDLASLFEVWEGRLTGDAAAAWDANTKPWVSPLEALAFSAQHDGDRMSGRLVITVR
jgi:hypothetical protein